jgi:hypothetical protein
MISLILQLIHFKTITNFTTMKKLVYSLIILSAIAFGTASCEDSLSNDIKMDSPEMPSNNPDEPTPGCNNPNGC